MGKNVIVMGKNHAGTLLLCIVITLASVISYGMNSSGGWNARAQEAEWTDLTATKYIGTDALMPHEAKAYGGTLVYAADNEPTSFAPCLYGGTRNSRPNGAIFDALFWLDWGLNIQPKLGTKLEVSADGLSYRVTLRANVTWHDGYPFTSADVKYTYQNLTNIYHSIVKPIFNTCTGIETPDDLTVIFHFSGPYPLIPLLFTGLYGAGLIMPKHLYEGTDPTNNTYNMNPIGTGPFKLKEFVKGEYVRLVRNENYWDPEKPYLDELIFRLVTDPVTRVQAMVKGEIDGASWQTIPLDAPLLAQLRAAPQLNLWEQSSITGNIYYLGFNLDNSILSNIKVRQAFAHAIDLTYLHDVAFRGLGKVPSAPVASGVAWAFQAQTPYEFNKTEAERLLDEAGYPRQGDGWRFKLTVIYTMVLSELGPESEAIKSMLADVGVDITVVPMEHTAMYAKYWGDRNYELVAHMFSTGPDAISMTARMFESDMIPLRSSYSNPFPYNNSIVDEAYANAKEQKTLEGVAEYLHIAWKQIWADLPCVFTWEGTVLKLKSVAFSGWAESPAASEGEERFEDIWWLEGTPVTVGMETRLAEVTNSLSAVQTTLGTMQWVTYGAVALSAIAIVVSVFSLRKRRSK